MLSSRKLWAKNFVGKVTILAFLSVFYLGGEFILGFWQDTAQIRQESGQFRAESAKLNMRTRHIVPRIAHQFRLSSSDGPDHEIRDFRTDARGNILGHTLTEPTGTKILFLGGSTTECNEVSAQNRFPFLVGQKLREAGAKVDSFNGGVRGHTSIDSINALINRADFRAAEVVVMMHNINDRLFLSARESYDVSLTAAGPTSLSELKTNADEFGRSVLEVLTYRSNLVFLLRTRLGGVNPWTGDVRESTRQDLLGIGRENNRTPEDWALYQSLFRQNLEIFVSTARSLGQKPVLMTQPLGTQVQEQLEFNRIIRDVASSQKVALIDLAETLGLPAQWAFLPDQIHLNDDGSKRVADIVASELAIQLGVSTAAHPIDLRTKLNQMCETEVNGRSLEDSASLALGDGRYPNISPDGRYLVVQDREGGFDQIFMTDLATTKLRRQILAPEAINHRHPFPTISSNGHLAVIFGTGYDDNDPTKPEQLMIIKPFQATTQAAVPLPYYTGSIPYQIGGDIFFAGSSDKEGTLVPDIFRYDSKSLVQITATPWEEWRPIADRSGNIYYIADRNGQFDIMVHRVGETSPRLFFGSEADEWDPALSPDDQSLAYASKINGNWDIFILPTNITSTNPRPVPITHSKRDEWDPSWHPNGKVLLFAEAGQAGSVIRAQCVD